MEQCGWVPRSPPCSWSNAVNPFNDVNTFGATDRVTRRPLDTKGELGARPVQQWKEMLREWPQYRKSHTWKIPDFEPWMPGSVADPSNPLHAFLDEEHPGRAAA